MSATEQAIKKFGPKATGWAAYKSANSPPLKRGHGWPCTLAAIPATTAIWYWDITVLVELNELLQVVVVVIIGWF